MKRSEMIENLLKLYQSFPKGASDYLKIDFLLEKAERLGMIPPKVFVYKLGSSPEPDYFWEEEEENEA